MRNKFLNAQLAAHCHLECRVIKGASATPRTLQTNMHLAPGHHVVSHVMERTSPKGQWDAWTGGGLGRAYSVSHPPLGSHLVF